MHQILRVKIDYYASFWKIALPILAIVTPLALLSDLKNIWLYFQHRGDSRKAIRVRFYTFFIISLFLNLYLTCETDPKKKIV